jgi:hypothetical protein
MGKRFVYTSKPPVRLWDTSNKPPSQEVHVLEHKTEGYSLKLCYHNRTVNTSCYGDQRCQKTASDRRMEKIGIIMENVGKFLGDQDRKLDCRRCRSNSSSNS